jgi:hypothetical protein
METAVQVVQEFLQKYLTDIPKSIPDKIKHWLFVANSPEKVYPDADATVLARKRRNARNNVRRLAKKYARLLPAIATELENER